MSNPATNKTAEQPVSSVKINSVKLIVLRNGREQEIPSETPAALAAGERLRLEIDVWEACNLTVELKLQPNFTQTQFLHSAVLPKGSGVRVPPSGWLMVPQGIANAELRVRPPVKGSIDRSDDLMPSPRGGSLPQSGGADHSTPV